MFAFHCSDKIARKSNLKEELLVCRSVVMGWCRPLWRKVKHGWSCSSWGVRDPWEWGGENAFNEMFLLTVLPKWPTSSLLCTATPSSSVVTSWEQCLCHERLGVKIQIQHVMWNVRSNCEPRVMRMENYSSNNYTFKDPTVWRTALGHV